MRGQRLTFRIYYVGASYVKYLHFEMSRKELTVYITLFFVVLFLLFTATDSLRLTPGAANVCERTEVYVTKKEVTRIAANSIGSYYIQKETKYEYAVRAEYYCCSGFSQTNDSCSKVCDEGQYGENCTQSCICSPYHKCRLYDGYCFCPAGYQGTNCGIQCDKGTYGTDCNFNCTCLNGASCDHINGSCACLPGFRGTNCETAITSGSGTDDQTTPADGQAGSLTSSNITIIAVVLVAVVVLLVVLLFVIYKRQSLSTKWHKSLSIGRADSSSDTEETRARNNERLAQDNHPDYAGVMPPRLSTGETVELDPKYTSVQQAAAKSKSEKAQSNGSKKPPVPRRQKPSTGKKSATTSLPTYAKVDKSQDISNQDPTSTVGTIYSKPQPSPNPPLKSQTLPTYDQENLKICGKSGPPPTYATIDDNPSSNSSDHHFPVVPTQTIPSISYGIQEAVGKDNAYDLLDPNTMKTLEMSAKEPTPPKAAPNGNKGHAKSSAYDVPANKPYATPNTLAINSISQSFSPRPKLPSKKGIIGDPYGVTDLSKTDLSPGESEIRHTKSSDKKANTPDALMRIHASSDASPPIDQPSAANPVYATLENDT